MVQLRHKLEADATRPRYLVTEPGIGYRLKSDVLARRAGSRRGLAWTLSAQRALFALNQIFIAGS
jgi:hypothetical protein